MNTTSKLNSYNAGSSVKVSSPMQDMTPQDCTTSLDKPLHSGFSMPALMIPYEVEGLAFLLLTALSGACP